jgi:hypothetical protein
MHWMPKRNDCPYPEVVYSEIHDATTFERYQSVTRFALIVSDQAATKSLITS